MALRLSSAGATSVDGYIQQITEDTSISLAQKSDCLKTLTVVLKNLIAPSKGAAAGDAGLKYRTLKTDNPKLRAKIFCGSSHGDAVRNLLMSSSVGMIATETTLTMEDAPSPSQIDSIGLKVLPAISTAQRDIAAKLETSSGSENCSKKAKLTEQKQNNNNKSSGIQIEYPGEKLSEKQKARRAMEDKKHLEKAREKAYVQATRAKIAADKLVRQKDENWKPAVSAASAKTGTGLLSFRDRHAEE